MNKPPVQAQEAEASPNARGPTRALSAGQTLKPYYCSPQTQRPYAATACDLSYHESVGQSQHTAKRPGQAQKNDHVTEQASPRVPSN